MINKQKIKIYLGYPDSDFLARAGKKGHKALLSDEDWFLIDNLVQDIHLMKNNLVSDKMRAEIERRLKEYTEGDSELALKLSLVK